MLPDVLRRRREVQRTRAVADRALQDPAPLTLNPQVAGRGAAGLARRLLDGFFIGYWRCVRWACG
jgi:hypothetical protein